VLYDYQTHLTFDESLTDASVAWEATSGLKPPGEMSHQEQTEIHCVCSLSSGVLQHDCLLAIH